jgi:hypothetical protein
VPSRAGAPGRAGVPAGAASKPACTSTVASAAGPQWYGVCGKNGTPSSSARGGSPCGGDAVNAAVCGGSANTAHADTIGVAPSASSVRRFSESIL